MSDIYPKVNNKYKDKSGNDVTIIKKLGNVFLGELSSGEVRNYREDGSQIGMYRDDSGDLEQPL